MGTLQHQRMTHLGHHVLATQNLQQRGLASAVATQQQAARAPRQRNRHVLHHRCQPWQRPAICRAYPTASMSMLWCVAMHDGCSKVDAADDPQKRNRKSPMSGYENSRSSVCSAGQAVSAIGGGVSITAGCTVTRPVCGKIVCRQNEVYCYSVKFWCSNHCLRIDVLRGCARFELLPESGFPAIIAQLGCSHSLHPCIFHFETLHGPNVRQEGSRSRLQAYMPYTKMAML